MATNVLKNFGRSLATGATLGSATVSRNHKTLFSIITEVKKFYHTGRDLNHGIIVKRQRLVVFLDK